jgi:hypothetical protein
VVRILAYLRKRSRSQSLYSTNIYVHEHVCLYWVWVLLCIICMCLQKKVYTLVMYKARGVKVLLLRAWCRLQGSPRWYGFRRLGRLWQSSSLFESSSPLECSIDIEAFSGHEPFCALDFSFNGCWWMKINRGNRLSIYGGVYDIIHSSFWFLILETRIWFAGVYEFGSDLSEQQQLVVVEQSVKRIKLCKRLRALSKRNRRNLTPLTITYY